VTCGALLIGLSGRALLFDGLRVDARSNLPDEVEDLS